VGLAYVCPQKTARKRFLIDRPESFRSLLRYRLQAGADGKGHEVRTEGRGTGHLSAFGGSGG